MNFSFLVVAYIGFSLKTFFGDWFWLGMHAPAWWGLVTFLIVCTIIFLGATQERFDRECREEFYHSIMPRKELLERYPRSTVSSNTVNWTIEDFQKFFHYTEHWSKDDLYNLRRWKEQEWQDLRDDLRLAYSINKNHEHLDKKYRLSVIREEEDENYQNYKRLCKKYDVPL